MAGSTPVYGFPYPQPSDLVANYPALGQELAEDVEAAIIGSGGLTLVTTATFTSASTISINNCFTSTYQGYLLTFDFSAASGTNDLFVRLRASGSDHTGQNYRWAQPYYSTISATSGYNRSNTTTLAAYWAFGIAAAGSSVSAVIRNPQTAQNAQFESYGMDVTDFVANFLGFTTITTQFDGFTAYNMNSATGIVRVYGFKNS